MKKFLFVVATLAIVSCHSSKEIISSQPQEEIIYKYIDTPIYHDSIIYREITKEVIKDIVPIYDTLYLETSLAETKSYVDTSTHTLKGEIKHKNVKLPVEIQWEDRVIIKDSIVFKTIEKPVDHVIYKWHKITWWLLIYAILSLAYFVIKLFEIKLYKK